MFVFCLGLTFLVASEARFSDGKIDIFGLLKNSVLVEKISVKEKCFLRKFLQSFSIVIHLLQSELTKEMKESLTCRDGSARTGPSTTLGLN